MSAAPALETRGLEVRFGGLAAVDGVDFALARGEVCCLIGPNGAGKSTFFRAVTGQLRPDRGEVLVGGAPVAGRPPHEVAALGVAVKTQVPSLFDGLPAEENVLLAALRRSGPARARDLAGEALERMGLGGLRRREAGGLSHGERQRLELAMVAAAEPSLVLLDEPAAGATRAEAEAIAGFVRSLGGGCAVAVVEHDMQFVRMVSGRVSVFHEGRILTEGPAEEVLRDPEVREVYLGGGRR